MDARELVYRVHEKCRAEADRIRYHAGAVSSPDDAFTDFKNLAQTAEPLFYFRAAGVERKQCLDFIFRTFPQWMDHVVEDAERTCRHQVRLLGFNHVDLGK